MFYFYLALLWSVNTFIFILMLHNYLYFKQMLFFGVLYFFYILFYFYPKTKVSLSAQKKKIYFNIVNKKKCFLSTVTQKTGAWLLEI